MFCEKCGNQLTAGEKFCASCGAQVLTEQSSKQYGNLEKEPQRRNVWKIISWVIVVLAIGGFSVYSRLDNQSVEQNNKALESFDSGNSDDAIKMFEIAKETATSNENKLNSLKNLGYVYSSEYDEKSKELALSTFKEALELTTANSFDYYLVSAEIALLEGKPTAALLAYNKAYELNPKDFQINNALALFYLDIEDIASEHSDYVKGLTYAKKAFEYDTEKLENTKQNLAIAYFFNENYDKAIELLQTTDFVQQPNVHLWLGLSYAGKGDRERAVYHFQTAMNSGLDLPQEIKDYLNEQ